MWQRFTIRARRVVLFGQEQALRAHSSAVDTEHLLLGLFLATEEQIGQLLEKAGATPTAVRSEAVAAVEGYEQASNDGEPKFTSPAKRTLELAADEARRMRHDYIGTEHLLLALIREERGRASQILLTQGATLEKARSTIMESAMPSQKEVDDEAQLLSLLERRPDLLVEILGLDVLALKKARLKLLMGFSMFESAALLRDEIENEQS